MAHNQFELLKQRRFLPFFLTQSLGAFNDNVYRQAIIGLLGYLAVPADQKTLYTNLAPAIFILPYFLLSATAGQIAEKLEKSRLIRITTVMEIAIMSLASIGFLTQNMVLLLIALFCTGLQSTLFGPVKYAILPNVLHPEELTGGNGLVEMGTSMSILLGMLFGGMIFSVAGENGPVVASIAIVALAIAGNLVSRAIPRVEPAAPDLKIHWNPIPESLAVMRLASKQPAVRNAMLGISWFWFIGTVLTANLPTYADVHLGAASTSLYLLALALFSIGTGIGSLACEKLSQRTVEIGLVPLGAIGMTAFLIDLYFARPGVAPTTGLDVATFLAQPGSWRILIDLTGIGVFAGFYVVPLFALVQSRTPKRELSRVIAALNIQNSLFIVAAAVAGILAQRWLGLSITQTFLVAAIAGVAVSIYIFTLVPEFLMRFLSWLIAKAMYRVEVRGIEEHVPDEGPALLVCNHVSYMDPLIIMGAVPRPTRFVMYYKIFNITGARWLFRTARAIPIAGAKEDPAVMEAAFAEVDRALAEGEIVGIFPEGKLTTDGEIAQFKAGVERILKTRPVPVVPMALSNLWRSMFSKRDSRLGRLRLPRHFRAHIELVAGPPIPGAQATAEMLETKVRALRGDKA